MRSSAPCPPPGFALRGQILASITSPAQKNPQQLAPAPFPVPPDMLELLAYLHDPGLVARFQRRCGLFHLEAAHHIPESTRAPRGTLVHANKLRGHLRGRWDHQDNNSNYEYKDKACAVDVSSLLHTSVPSVACVSALNL